MHEIINNGTVFTHLTVLGVVRKFRKSKNTVRSQIYYNCLCHCGKTTLVDATSLRHGRTKSCGCLRHIYNPKPLIHGDCNSPEYYSWRSMLERCNNPKHKSYKDYGGRGIFVNPDWLAYKIFLSDMGRRPSINYTLDRIDNAKGYCVTNCRWATTKEQAHNRRNSLNYTFEGELLNLKTIADRLNMNYITLYNRLNVSKMPFDKAISLPIQKKICLKIS